MLKHLTKRSFEQNNNFKNELKFVLRSYKFTGKYSRFKVYKNIDFKCLDRLQ